MCNNIRFNVFSFMPVCLGFLFVTCANLSAQDLLSAAKNASQPLQKLCSREQPVHSVTDKLLESLLCGKDLDVTISEIRLELDVLLNSTLPENVESMKKAVINTKAALTEFEKTPYSVYRAHQLSSYLSQILYCTALFGIEKDEKIQVLWGRITNHTRVLSISADAMLMEYDSSKKTNK